MVGLVEGKGVGVCDECLGVRFLLLWEWAEFGSRGLWEFFCFGVIGWTGLVLLGRCGFVWF